MNEPVYARLDRHTARVQVPAPQGVKVRLSITGTWNDPKLDPTPARIELRSLGGPPHRGNDLAAKGQHVTELRRSLYADTAVDLPEEVAGVSVEVKRHAPGMDLLVRLVPLAVDTPPPEDNTNIRQTRRKVGDGDYSPDR